MNLSGRPLCWVYCATGPACELLSLFDGSMLSDLHLLHDSAMRHTICQVRRLPKQGFPHRITGLP